jgi:hypothetical protein
LAGTNRDTTFQSGKNYKMLRQCNPLKNHYYFLPNHDLFRMTGYYYYLTHLISVFIIGTTLLIFFKLQQIMTENTRNNQPRKWNLLIIQHQQLDIALQVEENNDVNKGNSEKEKKVLVFF